MTKTTVEGLTEEVSRPPVRCNYHTDHGYYYVPLNQQINEFSPDNKRFKRLIHGGQTLP